MRRYTDDHEWLSLDGNIATVGITAFATTQLGDLVFIELPKIGDKVEKGKAVGVVESVKAASDVYAPLSGEVVEVNAAVVADPTIVGSDPLVSGWFYRMRLADPAAFDALMDEAAYGQLTS